MRRLEVIIQEETDAIVFFRLIREGDTASETDATILGNNGATRQGKRRISYIASQQFTSDIPSGCDRIRKIRTSHRHNGIKSFMFCDLIARTAFAPTEVSISSVTAVFGAPIVIYMMIHRKAA